MFVEDVHSASRQEALVTPIDARLFGGIASDKLTGGLGNDKLSGRFGNDQVNARCCISLHTYGDEESFGMPTSIAEALAAGAFTLVRDLSGTSEYLGTAGVLSRTNDDAVKAIQSTLSWSHDEWQSQQTRAAAYTRQRFASERVLRPLLDDWLSITQATCFVPSSQLRAA